MIKSARKRHKITQEQLASNLGLTRSYISKLENRDKNINPTLKQMISISKALKISPYGLAVWFIDGKLYVEYAEESICRGIAL